MRYSQLFGRTLREDPTEAEIISHRLLQRAGFIKPLASGIYTQMPLGWRVCQKIMAIFRQEMNALGCQELSMPVLNPAELWQQTGRWDSVGPALVKLKDRNQRDLALAMTHEETLSDILRTELESYKQLPILAYHIQTKIRDEPRPRGGLIRVREFLMKDAYSVHANQADIDRFYPDMVQAYRNIYATCDLEIVEVEADAGMMGGSDSHEFMVLSDSGEDTIFLSSDGLYAANAERAVFDKGTPLQETPGEIQEVYTPDCKTIAQVADYLGVPQTRTVKAVFYLAENETKDFIFVVIRGDLPVNEVKLGNALSGLKFRPATEEEIEAAGAVPGYATPIGLKKDLGGGRKLIVVADDSAVNFPNLVSGANKPEYHFTNTNAGRDYQPDIVADIALARDGDKCVGSEATLQLRRGIEVGHCFKLGQRYSKPMGVTFLDENGKAQIPIMGSYGIGVGRLMAAIVEQHHDEKGIIWPESVAPFDVHLVSLAKSREDETGQQAEAIYQTLLAAGIEVLYDDRKESPGVKFADADLIGIPWRVTVSSRSLQNGGVEVKRRSETKAEVVPLDGFVEYMEL
ncbi:MAG: proline--tRNA ligase [Anaerolineae bacterium]|nr:proline--tRNA ligase [Anaerolineales bacterium]MCQ3976404.1 proline--tRNA ligase [Anaerolineae bacterium]